ncbi:ABC-type molybdate transport system, periplasmic component [Burkholderiales bacterium JOSHI_001]|nr:ABC-type molybdate transport system, periplasmic component [Burkholderiales bacterium JOSHI_001]
MTTLNLLSAGAARGLVLALQAQFSAATGATLNVSFGAVGAMREALLGGAPCDVIILTDALIDALAQEGRADATSRAALGRVRTGVAVRAGCPHPDVATAAGLKAALQGADALYFPDPAKATAGIHFAHVMRELGVHDALAPHFHAHPNGATAMRELAASTSPQPIGCTQVTEILYTPGVELVGLLPTEFELATVYTAAVTPQAADAALAAQFIALLAGDSALALRRAGGFEVQP